MADWHLLIWGKDKAGMGQAKEGDIIDVMPATTEWAPNNMETKLCLIVPVSGLTRRQAMRLKEGGLISKRKYKVDFTDIGKVEPISVADIRNNKKYYQPLLEKGVKTDLNKVKFVKDKAGNVVNMGSIELRI